jgi:hypothetical protein
MSPKAVIHVSATLLLAVCAMQAQDSGDQAQSLGDIARQSRAQRTAAEGQRNKAQDLADEMQAEQEASDNAPTGFRLYDAGDYRLFVPFPFSDEGRDNFGPVLLGSRLGVTHSEVLAGEPVPFPPYVNENTVQGFVQQLASRYTGGAGCAPLPFGSHQAFRCGINNGSLLGHSVSGSMEFIVVSNGVIPVMCVIPNEPPLTCHVGNQPCNAYQTRDDYQHYQNQLRARNQETVDSARMCEQIVFPSIALKEDMVAHPAKMAEGKPKAVSGPVLQDTSVVTGTQTLSPADLAKSTRVHTKAAAEVASVAPAGFQSFVLQYCQNPQLCAEASIFIPEKSESVSHVNGQQIFKVTLDGESAFLYAGPADVNAPYRNLTDPEWVHVRDINAVNGWGRDKSEIQSGQELDIDGRNAFMARVRYQRDQKRWWIGERVIIALGNGSQFLLACTAPEDHFKDAEPMCNTLIKSLRLP